MNVQIVSNYRRLFGNLLPNDDLHLTDREIWALHEKWATAESDDACIVEKMQEANNMITMWRTTHRI